MFLKANKRHSARCNTVLQLSVASSIDKFMKKRNGNINNKHNTLTYQRHQ